MNLDRLATRVLRVAQEANPAVTEVRLTELNGGMSSLTYRVDLISSSGADVCVLKVAPPRLAPTGSRDVLRQTRLLNGLAQAGTVPVPAVWFSMDAESVDDPPFFAMDYCAGETYEPVLHGPRRDLSAGTMRERVFTAIRTLAELHAVDAATVGLGYEPPVSLEAEIERWERALTTVSDDLRIGADAAAQALRAEVPAGRPPTLIHGDYRLGNLLFDGTELTAVVDWEIWARNDSRTDLGWLCLMASPDELPLSGVKDLPLPSVAEIVEIYQRASGYSVRDWGWFRALTQFRYAASLSLLVKRQRRNPSSDPDALALRAQRIRLMLANVPRFVADS